MRTIDLLRRCFPENKVGGVFADDGAVFVAHVYSQHLRCWFPQAGALKKHERAIALSPTGKLLWWRKSLGR